MEEPAVAVDGDDAAEDVVAAEDMVAWADALEVLGGIDEALDVDGADITPLELEDGNGERVQFPLSSHRAPRSQSAAVEQ